MTCVKQLTRMEMLSIVASQKKYDETVTKSGLHGHKVK